MKNNRKNCETALVGNKPNRQHKLFRSYTAVGYIARYIWLPSKETDNHVCMALWPDIHLQHFKKTKNRKNSASRRAREVSKKGISSELIPKVMSN